MTPKMLPAAAELYATLGWCIVPLHGIEHGRCSCGRPECEITPGKPTSAGKHPRLNEWQKHATDDLAQVRAWWRQWPNANIGARTGSKSGFVAIDIDPPGGEECLQVMSEGDLPPTVEMRTGKGRRLLYAIPESLEVEPRTVPFKDDDGLESIRLQGGATGSQCVLPPSMHYLGHRYEWVDGRRPDEIAMTTMPGWMQFEMCRPKEPSWGDASNPKPVDGSEPWTDFNRREKWEAWLKAWDYKPAGKVGDVRRYTRPGKTGGVSVTVGHYTAKDGTPALYVFSGSIKELAAGKCYDLFGAYARIECGGDFAAAARSLLTLGYGRPKAIAITVDRIEKMEARIAALETKLAHPEHREVQPNV